MAKIYEPSDEQLASWNAWVAELPPDVRDVAERINPWSLYRLKQTGQLVRLMNFRETLDKPVTLTVAVSATFNLVPFETAVFGINPDDLEPAELPGPDAPVGVMLEDNRDVAEYIEWQKAAMFGPAKRPQ